MSIKRYHVIAMATYIAKYLLTGIFSYFWHSFKHIRGNSPLTHLLLVTHICASERAPFAQVKACRLLGAITGNNAELLSIGPDPQEQTLVKLEPKYKTVQSRKCTWKCRRWSGGQFVQREMSLRYKGRSCPVNHAYLERVMYHHMKIIFIHIYC